MVANILEEKVEVSQEDWQKIVEALQLLDGVVFRQEPLLEEGPDENEFDLVYRTANGSFFSVPERERTEPIEFWYAYYNDFTFAQEIVRAFQESNELLERPVSIPQGELVWPALPEWNVSERSGVRCIGAVWNTWNRGGEALVKETLAELNRWGKHGREITRHHWNNAADIAVRILAARARRNQESEES